MLDRRGFLKGSAALAGMIGVPGAFAGCAAAPKRAVSRGPGGAAGIDHIVVVMMENRSFDHFLGWLPGADGKQAGLSFLDAEGVSHDTHHLEGFASCEFADPGHSREAGRIQLNGGRNDGFMKKSPDTLPIGYYEQADLPFMGRVAEEWTVCDNYFAATLGPTFPNRFYQHCGQSDRWENWLTISSLRTIWDRLSDAGLEGRYYYSDVPFSALLGVRHALITRTYDQFLSDCSAGLLPNVSFVDPKFLIPPLGSSTDYHPASDIRLGDRFLHDTYEAVTNSPNWERTVLVINFDEWGGFYDHVAPPVGADSHPGLAQRGFRVPCVVASPLAKRGNVAHGLYDHTSVLKMIEWAWDLPSLAPRDAAANNLADVLDLGGTPDLSVPHWSLPSFTPADCTPNFVDSLWAPLRDQARALGFSV